MVEVTPGCVGNVNVVVLATVGADSVIVPLVSPEMTTELIYFLYKTTQREPEGKVTVIPAFTVIGPVLMALKPLVTV